MLGVDGPLSGGDEDGDFGGIGIDIEPRRPFATSKLNIEYSRSGEILLQKEAQIPLLG